MGECVPHSPAEAEHDQHVQRDEVGDENVGTPEKQASVDIWSGHFTARQVGQNSCAIVARSLVVRGGSSVGSEQGTGQEGQLRQGAVRARSVVVHIERQILDGAGSKVKRRHKHMSVGPHS